MPFANLYLVAVALILAAESLAETSLKDDSVIAKFDKDYGLTSERKEVEGFKYTLHNFTFSASNKGGGGHERVKRLQEAVESNVPLPLCVMTFNIKTYSFQGDTAAYKDMVIARVSGCIQLLETFFCCWTCSIR